MKKLAAMCMLVTASFAWAGETPPPPAPAAPVVKGQVVEAKYVQGYTYLRLKTEDGEIWAAVGKAPVKSGDKVTIENPIVMKNFESKSLKRTFPTIIFGNLGGAAGSVTAAPHAGAAKAIDAGDIHVPKASGPNAQTVAEIITKSAELKDKTVLVRGKVVKYTPEIMGKNWVHLRDGTGSGANNTNDLLVTTAGQTNVGSVVTVKGVVRTDKDFGAGYSYKVLLEEATLQP